MSWVVRAIGAVASVSRELLPMASYARPAVLVALLVLAIQPAGGQGFLDFPVRTR